MEQTIQIADKPTLDEVKELLENSGYGLEALKNLLGEQDSKQEEYIHFSGSFGSNDLVYEYRNVLNVNGKGKLYLALADVDVNSRNTGVKITINPNLETEKVVFMRKIGGATGSTSYCSVGFLCEEFYSQKCYVSSDGYYIAPCKNRLGTKVKLLTSEDAVSDASTRDASTIHILLLKNPIKFSGGVKIDVYCNGSYNVIYTLDDE